MTHYWSNSSLKDSKLWLLKKIHKRWQITKTLEKTFKQFVPSIPDFGMLRRGQVCAQKVSLDSLFRQVEVQHEGLGGDQALREAGALSTVQINLAPTTATGASGLALVFTPSAKNVTLYQKLERAAYFVRFVYLPLSRTQNHFCRGWQGAEKTGNLHSRFRRSVLLAGPPSGLNFSLRPLLSMRNVSGHCLNLEELLDFTL
jgi:hypothetical protein